MSDTLIKVENVSKKFCRSLKKSLWYGMQDLGNELFGRRHGRDGGPRDDEFWAVRGVNFKIKRGEAIGIIGRNGSGKTTLLRMLNGLIKPDQGCIEVRGRVGGLIALGAGFNPVLTGRENIYVNAAVLGLSKRETDKQIDEIIDFSGLAQFIDSPVQTYSSGMMVRLGFSIATALSPDILLLDEVLAVGDEVFQRKCFERLDVFLRRQDKVLIFVSHNMRQVERLCSRGILLDQGYVLINGPSSEACNAYHRYALMEEHKRLRDIQQTGDFTASGEISVVDITLYAGSGQVAADEVMMHRQLTVGICIRCHTRLDAPEIILGFHTPESVYVMSGSSYATSDQPNLTPGEHYMECTIPDVVLVPGVYYVRLAFLDKFRRNLWDGHRLHPFKVVPGPDTDVMRMPQMTLIDMPFSWKLDAKGMTQVSNADMDIRRSC